MKYILIALAAIIIYSFVPSYELYVVKDPLGDSYSLEDSGIYSRKTCMARAEGFHPTGHCRKTSYWSTVFSNYTDYSPAVKQAKERLRSQ